MKKVIYTCLVGGYDELKQPLVVDSSFDYICFSNDIKDNKIGIWEIRPIPYENKDMARLSRYVKLLPHMVLKEYDWSLWLDANVQITGREIYDILNVKINTGNLICQVPHLIPPVDCVYDEIKRAYLCGRCGIVKALKQYFALKKSCFPKHFGLFENNIILRKHNDPLVIKISEDWWKEFSKYTKRDQFNLMYVYWKNDYYPSLLFGEKWSTRNVVFLQWRNHIVDQKLHSLFLKIDNSVRTHIRYVNSKSFKIVDYFFLNRNDEK